MTYTHIESGEESERKSKLRLHNTQISVIVRINKFPFVRDIENKLDKEQYTPHP